jgi:hypothetical protein
MIEYLSSIIPRLEKFSRKLDKTEIFVEKTWIHIDESSNHHEYMFMRDKRLILSVNGAVITGTWELLPNGKLLLNRVKDEILFQNIFFTDAIMILQKSGSNEDPFTFINEDRIPDLDVVRYLQDLDESLSYGRVSDEKSNTKETTVTYEPEPGVINILSSGKIIAHSYIEGNKVKKHDGSIVNGTFPIPDFFKEAYMDVKNGTVALVYRYDDFKTSSGEIFRVKRKYHSDLKGSFIEPSLSSVGIKPDKWINITCIKENADHDVKVNCEGLIYKDIDFFLYKVVIGSLFLMALLVLALIF